MWETEAGQGTLWLNAECAVLVAVECTQMLWGNAETVSAGDWSYIHC
jgi:hypothetical protein